MLGGVGVSGGAAAQGIEMRPLGWPRFSSGATVASARCAALAQPCIPNPQTSRTVVACGHDKIHDATIGKLALFGSMVPRHSDVHAVLDAGSAAQPCWRVRGAPMFS